MIKNKIVPRGIRNNNAGNIRKGGNWLGLDIAKQDTDKEYCVFISPEYGIRALAKLLLNYQKIHRLNTVDAIIKHENGVQPYSEELIEKALR